MILVVCRMDPRGESPKTLEWGIQAALLDGVSHEAGPERSKLQKWGCS